MICLFTAEPLRHSALAPVFFIGGTIVAELAWPGRAALALAGLALFAVAAFPSPAVGESSPEHRNAALSTIVVGSACVAFAWIEASPDPALVGLAEREPQLRGG